MATDRSPGAAARSRLAVKRRQARELFAAVRRGEVEAAWRFVFGCQRFRGKRPADVLADPLTLADAQEVIARESGFDRWPTLERYFERWERDPEGAAARFEEAVRCVIEGDEEGLARLLADDPTLAQARSPRSHGAVLLHYVAANGVENEHQRTPPNAVAIAQLLFRAGATAVVDATAGVYGGSTPLVALVTSCHPHRAGVQAELVRVFCRNGARVNGIDDDGMPLASALHFRYPAAARALAECGARIDNAAFAAALGRVDLLPSLLREGAPYPRVHPSLPVLGHREVVDLAMVFAGMCGQREAVELLLAHGVGIDAAPIRRQTALHEAAYQGNLAMVRFLLERGADPTRREEQWGGTPRDWAAHGGHREVVALLESWHSAP